MLKVLKPDAAAWIDVEHPLDMGCTVREYGGHRYGTHQFSTGNGTCTAVSVFLHLLFAKTPRSVTVLDRQKASCLSGSMIQLCVGTLLAFRPHSIKVSLPSLCSQRHSNIPGLPRFLPARHANGWS